MGLTIHYQFASAGGEAHTRKLVQGLRQTALDLPFKRVGEIAEFRGDECNWRLRGDDAPHRWLLIQCSTRIALPVTAAEKRRGIRRELDVLPQHVIAFETRPGRGSEPANFGLCRFPAEVVQPGVGKVRTKLRGWTWSSFCKTHYASDPGCGGVPNFLRCHLSVIALLDEAKRLGFLSKVSDEGDFWETRSLERLVREIGEQSAILASFLGALKDTLEQAGGAVELKAPIAGYRNFEHLEARGERLLPGQVRSLLKELACSKLLRGSGG